VCQWGIGAVSAVPQMSKRSSTGKAPNHLEQFLCLLAEAIRHPQVERSKVRKEWGIELREQSKVANINGMCPQQTSAYTQQAPQLTKVSSVQ
jgi:hypothetical protein